MPRRPITTFKIRKVAELTSGEFGPKRTVVEACAEVGISPASFYRKNARRSGERYPALERDWDELARAYEPKLPSKKASSNTVTLRRRVGDIFRHIYGKAASTRTVQAVSEDLEDFANALERLIMRYQSLDPEAQALLEAAAAVAANDESLSLSRLMADLEAMSLQFPEVVESIRQQAHLSPRPSGGPVFDTRVRNAATLLGTAFTQHLGQLPTAWSAADGTPGSAFQKFGLHAFAHFLGSDRPPDDRIDEALTWTSKIIDFEDDLPEEKEEDSPA